MRDISARELKGHNILAVPVALQRSVRKAWMPSVLPCVNWKEPDISCAIRDAIKVGGLQIPSMSSMNSPSQICPSRIRLHQIRKTRIW